jgi:arginyl-tRNA synthetase
MEGNSAPYLQYAYARISSVYDKYHAQYPEMELSDHAIHIEQAIERKLAVKLTRFPAAIQAATENYRPNILASTTLRRFIAASTKMCPS